jgi:iron-sulfur cluster assembly protein
MVEFTESAIKTLKQSVEDTDYLRIAVRGGGCSGFMYDMQIEEEPSKGDEILEFDGVKICIDRKSSFMLTDTTIDYETTLSQSGFKFVNKKATGTCGCGSSFSC